MNISQHWRLKSQRYQLTNSAREQGNDVFPPRPQVEQRELHHYTFDAGIEANDMDETNVKPIEMELVVAR